MMTDVSISRRQWVIRLSATTMVQIAAAQQHAHDALQMTNRTFQFLAPANAIELEALTAQIIPSEPGSPGAREAGVVFFIDRALATFEADKREAYRDGMEQVQQTRTRLFPDSPGISSLTPTQQIELLHAIEKTEFFELLRTHTLWGFIGSPSHGGNHSKVGWKHIGFDDRMQFQPPFGYYDAQAKAGEKA
jgi:gluconate 2-dehydrogenase gamma chain